MKTIPRIGLIGVGGIGSYHLSAIQELEREGRLRLVAVADPGIERFHDLNKELQARGVRWHLDYRDLLNGETDLDAITIATPIPLHFEMAGACIERGIYVLLEKPPVPLIQQLEDLIQADTHHRVCVGFQMIASRCVQMLKQLICEGKLGRVREIRAGACWPRLDNYYARASWAGKVALNGEPVFDGPATNALAHLIHNIMYLAAEGREEFDVPTEVEGELYRARPIESYDTACLRGRFASQIEFSVAVTHATESTLPFSIEVRGTKGWARLSQDGAVLESSVGISCNCPETTQQLIDLNYGNFIDVIRGRCERFSTSLADTMGYVTSTNAMQTSSGEIHDIAPASIRRYERDGEEGFDVPGLREAVEQTLTSGRLFSEQGCPWAAATPEAIRIAPRQCEASTPTFSSPEMVRPLDSIIKGMS